MDIGAYATALAEDRRATPARGPDHRLVQAEVDGERLTSAEVASFFILLVVAGNETTRNAISHGVLALTRYPDEQRDAGGPTTTTLAPTAVEEIVRWASPVVYMRRTLTEDVRVGRRQDGGGRQGHAVVLLGQPRRGQVRRSVDLRRAPPSRTRMPDSAAAARTSAWAPTSPAARSASRSRSCTGRCPIIAATEEPDRLQSAFIHGIKRLPVVLDATEIISSRVGPARGPGARRVADWPATHPW